MEASDQFRRRRSLQDHLGIVCCDIEPSAGGHGDDLIDQLSNVIRIQPESNPATDCISPSPRMNLAAALAAERQSRTTDDGGSLTSDNSLSSRNQAPARMSLMRLLEETEEDQEGVGLDLVCCVCMGRKKGAAFIPCGHTFCRVCSRELWLNRGSCPLCNRPILEVLDIF